MQKIMLLLTFVVASLISAYAQADIVKIDTIKNRVVRYKTSKYSSNSYTLKFPNEDVYFQKSSQANKEIDEWKRLEASKMVKITPIGDIIAEKVRNTLTDSKKEMLTGDKIVASFLVDSLGAIKAVRYIISKKVYQTLCSCEFDKIDRLLRDMISFELYDDTVPYIYRSIKIDL